MSNSLPNEGSLPRIVAVFSLTPLSRSKAICEPLRQIVANAGESPSVVLQKVSEGKGAFGFNADTMVYEDLVKAGVVDPTKVARTALQNASSIAGLLLTTECLITEIKEEEKPPMPGGPGGGMGGMY